MSDPGTEAATFQVYKEYLLDVGRIGDRHQTLRTFYVSLLGALMGLLVLAGGDRAVFPNSARLNTGILVCGASAVVCVMWCLHMGSFRALFHAKFSALRELEKNLTARPFTAETNELARTYHVNLTSIDQLVAFLLTLVFIMLILIGAGSPAEVRCCEFHGAPS